jgi:hypothetical protein
VFLLPFLWSDDVNLAQGVALLTVLAAAFGLGTVAASVFLLTRSRSRTAMPIGWHRAAVPLMIVGGALLVSLFYVDYYLLQQAFVVVAGVVASGIGVALALSRSAARIENSN